MPPQTPSAPLADDYVFGPLVGLSATHPTATKRDLEGSPSPERPCDAALKTQARNTPN